jgi:DNA topoisomerase-1
VTNLVIVESPAKAKTIEKYLGKDFKVVASVGHIRDLPKSKLGVDIENNFEPQYENIKTKTKLINELKKQAKNSDKVYLATDPDREGEAISWHLAHILGLNLDEENRVTFNEITKSGITSGMENPRKIDIDKVDAQQARRILDRIVGYKLSPFLWRKIRKGLSAGRVQSVAVSIIVDREREIKNFVPQEYWSIDALFNSKDSKKPFNAKLATTKGKKIEITSKEQSDEILTNLADAQYIVDSIKKSVKNKYSAPPFTTSTLQQEASRRIGFQSRRTMQTAQALYEGINLPELGAVGLITYMRTDSLRVSNEARDEAYSYIRKTFGEDYIPEKPKVYKSKNNSQDAHEAIRPTMPHLTPASIRESLSSDQYKLYDLIFKRFIASQMQNALLDTVSVKIKANDYIFNASGFRVKFDGFTALYEESKDEKEEDQNSLPELNKGDEVDLVNILGNQHFTQPPARYTEATLIKALEEYGIGRPSTYAPTITTIVTRSYVEREAKQLFPTTLGEVTTDLMKDLFSNIVDVKFTANMEKELDLVEDGKQNFKKTLAEFYTTFDETLKNAEISMEGTRVKIPVEQTDIPCELCGANMVIKLGKYGKFLACPNFPDCKNTKRIVIETSGTCPLCGKKIIEKKSKVGKKYFGCEDNPNCEFMSWDEPTNELCPTCGKTLLHKRGKLGKIYCSNKECDFEKPIQK